jgi:hypothetical protein
MIQRPSRKPAQEGEAYLVCGTGGFLPQTTSMSQLFLEIEQKNRSLTLVQHDPGA